MGRRGHHFPAINTTAAWEEEVEVSQAVQPACLPACLSEHKLQEHWEARKGVRAVKKLDYYSRWRLDVIPRPGGEENRSHVVLAGPEKAKYPSTAEVKLRA